MGKLLDIEYLRSRLDYNADTGNFRYKPRPRHHFTTDHNFNLWHERFCGSLAGSEKGGYVYLFIDRKNILAHRVAWAIMTGRQPPAQIDHIDRDGTNNSWANLRDGRVINSRTRGRQRNNVSGVTGISWHGRAGKWQAYVRESGYQHYLGLFTDRVEAEQAVVAKRREIGFDATHGK